MSNIDIVQLGANIGKSPSDAIWIMVEKKNLSGLFVEPNSKCFKLLKEYYSTDPSHRFECAAIVPEEKPEGVEFYCPPEYLNLSVFGSICDTHRPENTVTTIVPALTVTQLFEKYNLLDKEFTLLQMDIEGMEDSVIRSIDFERIRPTFLRFEKVHIAKNKFRNLRKYLNKCGFYEIDDFIWEGYREHLTENKETLGWNVELRKFNVLFQRNTIEKEKR